MVKQNNGFKVAKILNSGTANPIVNRLSLQFFDILGRNLLSISTEDLEKIKKLLFELMKKMLKAEEAKISYLQQENLAIQKILSKNGIKFQRNAILYDDPTEDLKKKFEDFLVNSVISIRKVVKIADIVFNKNFGDGVGSLAKYLSSLFDKKSPEIKMIEEDTLWVKELFDLRRLVEHDELELKPFNISFKPNGNLHIYIPHLPNGKASVREYIEITLENCLTFCEDIIALLLNTRCLKGIKIVLIPEDKRSDFGNFKYTILLKKPPVFP